MTNLPPIDQAIANPEPRFPNDPETRRPSRFALQELARHDGSHDYPYSWGYTIFRTVYTPGSDEAVAKAVERLGVYAKRFTEEESIFSARGAVFDPRPVEELWSRYYCEVVEDEQTLANASESEVGERFDAWIGQHRRPVADPLPNGRFHFCLMLDEDSLENILAFPEDPHAAYTYCENPDKDGHKRKGWVKVISHRMKLEDEGGGGRWWLRAGIHDYLFSIWFIPFDPEIYVEEMGWPDADDGVQNLWSNNSGRW